MGVRHLFTFISRSVPNGLFEVNLFDEVEKYKRNYPEKTPVIIIDLLALHQKVYTNDHEILLGGRYNLYNDRARHMFSRLNELGAKIIYFCDGPTQPDKMKTCLKRRNENYDDCVKILHAIDDGLDLSQDIKTIGCRVSNLSTFFQNFIDIANSKNELHMSILNECDQEMANLANRMEALAIMSHDTDFLIFEGNWKFWSINDMNFETMTTKEFNKAALRFTLSLSSQQMILLGTLGGNDLLTYEMVQDYHNRIAPRGGKFYKIANDVRHMQSLPPKLSFSDENYILQHVFQPNNQTQGLRDLRNSLNWYSCNQMKNEYKNYTLQVVSNDPKRFNFIILGNQEYILSLVYFDLSTNHFMPYYQLIQPIMQRIMEILLYHRQNVRQSRKFYCKLTHDRPYELIDETPEYPLINSMPPLLKFLYHPYGRDKKLDQLRLQLFCWIVSSKLNPDMILQIPKENFITVVAILYLIEKNQITDEEGDCILIASNCNQELRDSLDIKQIKHVNGRDARLAFLYARIYNMIYNALSACGLGIFCGLLNFDGLYFHILRKKCQENDTKRIKEEITKYNNLRIYCKDKLLVK